MRPSEWRLKTLVVWVTIEHMLRNVGRILTLIEKFSTLMMTEVDGGSVDMGPRLRPYTIIQWTLTGNFRT